MKREQERRVGDVYECKVTSKCNFKKRKREYPRKRENHEYVTVQKMIRCNHS